ncbi:hypothetical protein SLE2022_182100 [Rubroshorea leprosula]
MDWGNKEKRNEKIVTDSSGEGAGRSVKRYAAFFWSFLVSAAGGMMLGWWEYEFHPSNGQLWMVPCGLILFFTPVFICFAVLVSDACSTSEDPRRPVKQSEDLVQDPERGC